MEAIYLTITLTIIALVVIWILPDGKKRQKTGITADNGDSNVDQELTAVVWKRMLDYDLISADIPSANDSLLRKNIKIQIQGLPFVDKATPVGEYAARVVKGMAFKSLQSAKTIGIANIKAHKRFFGLSAEIFVDGVNIADIIGQNFIMPMPSPTPPSMPFIHQHSAPPPAIIQQPQPRAMELRQSEPHGDNPYRYERVRG